ncbi:restriction endonuclease subunit S, partial [Aeromonas veronii]|uniref:restriction endonuclease subunit S n=1 Tax=Aeromonas veronii TaxID=654 RepID=UPI0030058764
CMETRLDHRRSACSNFINKVRSRPAYIRVSDMTARELDIDGMQRTSPQIAAAFARSTVDEGDIVYALRGKLGFVRSVPSSVAGANLTQGTARISPVPNIFGRYVFWALQSPRSLEQATQGAKGSTFVEITLASLKEIKIPVPRHKEEQKVIADALSDIDELIAGLEQLIAKKQAIKTAAMQQLLTGRTRLPAFALRPDGTTKGYKTSELGQIPEDWEVRYLKEVCGSFKTGKLDANAMKTDGEYRFYTCARSYYWIDSYAFDDDALLISGNGANVGYIHHYNGKFNAYQRTYVLTSFYSDIHFVKLQMEVNLSERIRVEVNAGNTPYITMDTLTDMCICLPKSIEEQTAIATILSDIDSELTALEQKLAKARDVKQGMMQQLLTGRIRLPLEVGA